MKMKLVTLALVLGLTGSVLAQSPDATLFVSSNDPGFVMNITAGMIKKHVPLSVTTNKETATYILQAAPIEVHSQSTGAKFARCIFAYCAGIEDTSHVSVQLVDAHTTNVLWAYTVAKGRGSDRNSQSMAEAIAKHLNEYLKKQKQK